MLLSDSVRKQWEDVHREMAAFVPILEFKLKEGEQSLCAVQCVTYTNTHHKPTGQTDHDLQQKEAATEGAASIEEHVKSLQELRETLTPCKSSCLATDQLKESEINVIVVRGDTVETRQDAEWTIIPETVAPPEEEHPLDQEVLKRYRTSCLVFQSQLQKNKQHLEQVIPHPVTISTLLNQKKQLQTLKQETEALWFEFELQYAQLSQSSHPMTREVERAREQLSQGWRGQQMCLQSRMTSLQSTADLMKSAHDHMELITQKLDRIIRESVDISSFTLADPGLVSDLKEMDDKLQSEMKKLSEQSSENEIQQTEVTSPSSRHQALHSSVNHLKQLRGKLEKVHSAAQALDRFLATVREVRAEIPTLLSSQDPSGQQNEAVWEQERHSWQAAMQQRLQTAAEQSGGVDSSLRAAGLTLTMDGATVMCQDVVTSLSKDIVDVEVKLIKSRKRGSQDKSDPVVKEQMQGNEESNPVGVHQTKTVDTSPQQGGAQEQEHPPPSTAEEKSRLEAKRSRQGGEEDTKTQRVEEHKSETWRSEGGVKDQRSSELKKGGKEKESLVQRRDALLGALREIRAAAEQLALQEPTLPALQHRTHVLTELKSHLTVLLSEKQLVQDAFSSGIPDVGQTREVEDLWEETTRTVTERLDQCCGLTQLLKRFQSLRGELSGTLQRAESIISEQASYVGKDNLQRLHTKIQETKAELSGLGDRIEDVRNVCRQLHTHLRHRPEHTIVPFESEADALMDQWLDISERTDSHLENLHLGLTLWEGVLQLGAEVESWTTSQLAVFAQSLSFQTEDGIKTLQNDIVAQEERMDHFHQRAAEIQSLLHSTELPVELQVVEIQMRKKMEQLKELVSEAEDYRQMVAAKGQITVRMAECFNSLQKIQDSLVTLSGSDIATVLAKLKELCWQLQIQDEQAGSLLEDLRVMATVASPNSLQSLCADGSRLQEKVRNTHQLFSETEEQTARNIQDLDRMQRECEHLEKWLQAAEEKAVKEEDLGLLQEEVLQQRVRTELLSQLVSALQNSTLQQSVLVEESSKLLEQYHNFHTNIQCSSKDKQQTLSRDIEVFQALSKSTQAWVEDLRQAADSPLSLGIQSPVEQKLHRAQALVSVTAEGEARLEELRVTGNSLSQRVCDRVDLKQEVKETIQKTEEQWTNLLQSLEPYYRVLQTGSELTSSYLAQRQEACCRVEALQRQTAQLPTLFPWPGTAERRHACLLARHLWDETESLQLTLTTLAEKRRDLAEQTNDTIWKDSSWVELDTCWSGLMAELKGVCSCLEEGVINEECFGQLLQDCDHELMSLQETMSACQAQKESSVGLLTDVPALEALLQKVTSVEKDLLQLVALKDSLTSSSTAEAQASLSQQVTNLQNHKRVLDSSIREKLTLLKENGNQRVQQVKEEVACVQAALKDLTENVQMLYGNHEVSPDISQLKQQWGTIQLCDTRLTELVARLYNMQKTGESKEMLHADAILAVDAVTKDLDSIKSIFLQKKHECAESTAVRVKQAISQLQQWSRTVQAQPSSPSQAALDEGLQLQQSLREVLSEKDFLLNCLGSKVSKSLEKEASNALSESTLALEMLSKYLVSQGPSDLDNEDLTGESVEESFRSECGAPHSAPPDESMVTCPPAFPFPSADDKMENSGTDQNDNKMKSKGCLDFTEPITNTSGESNVVADATKQDQAESLMQTSKEQTFVPNHVPSADIPEFSNSKTQQQSQQLTHAKSLTAQQDNTEPLQENTDSKLSATGTASNKDVSLAHCVTSLVGLPSTKPDNILLSNPENVFEHLIAQSQMFQEQEKHCEDLRTTPKKVLTVVLEMEPQDMQINVNVGPDVLGCSQKTELYDAELMAVSGTDSTEKKSGLLMLTGPESDKPDLKKHNLAAQSEIFKAGPVVHRDEDISSNKVFTIMLDMEQSEHDWASTFDSLRCLKGSEPCDAKLSDVSSTGIPEKKSGLFTALISPESVLRSHYLKSLKSHVSQVEDSLSESTELEEVKSTSAKLSSTENSDTHELMRSEVLNSSSSCETFSECQLTGAHAAETKFVAVKPEEVTDFCHMEEQTVSSVLCTVEASVQLRDTLTEMQIPAGDSKELMGADTAQSTDIGHAEMAEGEEVEETSDPKCPESKDSKMVQTQDSALLLEEECDSGLPSSLEDTREMQEQPEIQEGMEAEKTTLVSSADLGAGEATGGSSSSSCKRRSTMQDILSEIESLVERRNINRTPHMDLNWYLKCCPGESEIQLVRTVQRVLACRYQPAQLDVTAMAKQLQEAEEYRRCVQEQVAIIKGISAARVCDPDALKSAEGQWNAALLDASATVQVKAAQLEKVKQYHKQMKMIRAFLEVVATEKEKSSLNALGSSAVQTDKLHTLLQTMKGKKGMMEELIQLRSQLSVLLSDAESLAALLAQLGDVQEEWRLLEGSIKRALGHASNSTSQFVLLMKEADQLKAKLEALQKSSFQSSDNKSDLELVCLTTDLKLYIQLYLDLQSQSDALVHFCLGQKEQGEIQHNLQELGSLLNVTKRKLDTFSCRSNSSVKVNKQLQDLIIWAKKAENHISIGQRLALFPEEAHIQIVEMKKFQTDILSRHSKLQVQVEELKDLTADTEKEESNQVLKTIEELYEAVADSVDHVLDKMKKNLRERQKLLIQLSSLDAWLAKKYAARDPCTHIESVSRADIQKLESELECHKLDTVEIESQLNLLEVMAESCKDISVGLSPGESRHLVNRLSGLWMQLDGLLAHEKATSWELEGLIHEQTFSDEELSNIQGSLKIISTDLNQQRSPLKQETLSTIVHLKHMLMEHQCQVQELQHCQEDKRSSLLYTIGELQDRCRAVSLIAFEQDQYFHLRRQMEESMDIAKEQMQHIRDDTISMDERFTLCQTLLVELPLAKTRCQKTSDQLEAIAHELLPAELNSERQRIHSTMETLLSWEHSVTDDIKNLEAKLLFGLQFSIELPALIDLFQRTRVELEAAKPVSPDEKAIDDALQKYWVIWRNMESGIRVLEGLGRKEKINLKNYKELHSFRDAAMQECRLRMENLSQARESLKDYHLAAQGAIGFLRNAEATFLSAPGGFLDCSEEQQQTQQALAALEDGLQACSCHLVELVPQQPCLSRPKIEQLHIRILSQLLVGRAVLEAQAQLRLESLQRCSIRQQSHRRFHEDVQQRLSRFEARLSECAATQVTSYDKCVAQQKRATLMMEDLHSLSRKIEELRAGCPRRRCGVGKDSELGALWRRWASLRRGIGLLMAHTEQKGEEWKDITTSMEQCCSILASLQAEVPDSSTVTSTQEEPQELLAHAELHQAGLEQVQQALASLQHRLEHALSLSTSQDPISPGPAGKTLVKIQENVRSLKERNLLVVAAAQAEENERLQVQDKIEEVEKHVSATLLMLEACSDPSKQQELKKDLSSQKAKLQCIMEGVRSRYAEIPADISRRLQVVHLSLQRSEEKHIENSKVVQKLVGQVAELSSGLEKVEVLLEQRSPTVSEAQNVLKRVWDNLDAWHSCLMLLESEVQDLAEEQTDQVHLLMDQLTEPLQLYQKIAQRAEQRTSFLSKIPTSLQEFEDILCSATCWLDEAQSWLTAPCSFTTARSLQSHANSLQLVLDDSKRIRDTLQDFRPVLAEISAVCDIRAQEGRLDQNDQQIQKMQRNILEPLEQLLQTVAVVEAMEAELKTMEKNVPKIRTILSSMENSNIPLTEHVHNRQVILANVQLMRRTLEDMEKCRTELHLPQGAEESPLIFSRAKLLLQSLTELENLTQQQTSRLEQEDFEASNSVEEEEEEDDESCHSSSSDTLTCSVPEDPEETLGASDVQSDAIAEITPPSDVQELESLSHHFSSKVETSSKGAVLLSVKSWFDSCDFGATAEFVTMDSTADAAEASATTESLTTAATPAADDGFTVTDVLELCESPTDESLVSDPHTKSIQAAAAVEDTGLTPASPVTPFTAIRASVNFTEERDDLSSSTDLDTPSGLKTQGEVSTSQSSVEESKAALESKVPVSLTRHEDGKEQISQLYTQLSPKRTTLKKVEEYQTLISSEDGGAHEKELASNLLCFLDELDLGQSEISSLKDARSLEQCVLGRHLRESPGEKAKLQQVSRFLLQGLTRLLELGEERIREMQMNQVHNCSQHQAILCGHQKLLQFLRSQLAFVQHLFQCEPEALRYQEDERVQLEIRAKALQQQAVEQEAASQRRLQEWTHWEDNCGRLGRVLDEFDAFIISGEPEGEDDEDFVVQHRLDACQQTLVQLDESRAALGLLLDQRNVLRMYPAFAASVSQTGGALELRWRAAYSRTEQEIQRCRDIQDSRARFQTNFASVSKWLVGANKHLKSLSDLADTCDLNQECLHSRLIQLLDFCMEVEAMSVQRASVSRTVTRLIQLREDHCLGLRAQLAQLDVSWSQLTSDLSTIQDQLQQRLLAAWPPVQLLSDLEDWLKMLEGRLSQEKAMVLKAKDAAQVIEALQHYQELKAGVDSGQLLLDFLCQHGPQAGAANDQALQSERTMFAETLGSLRLQWLHLQWELEKQVHEAEQIHHTCADRERRLQQLHGWIVQQKKQLNQWKQSTSQTLVQKALLDWEAAVGRAREVAEALQELKATRVHAEKEEAQPCDIAFSNQAESISHACEDLGQQMEALRPTLQQTVAEWSCFDQDLREVTLLTTRVRCALQHQQAPLLSLKQAEEYMHLLQQLQEKAGKGGDLWTGVEKSYQSLVKTLHHGVVQALDEQVEGERKWWKDVVWELKEEHVKTGETLSLWQEYSLLSDHCSLHLQNLWHQWEELLSSSSSPERDTQALVYSVKKLQDAAESLKSIVDDALAASKRLMERLEPSATNLVQSEISLLSHDVLLLNQAVKGKKKSLEEDLEEQKRFHAHLEALDKQMQSMRPKLEDGLTDTDSVEQVLLELSALFPSLVDIREMSGSMNLKNQETERLHMLSREWTESMIRISDMNGELRAEHQLSQNFQEKSTNLMSIQEKLEQELVSRKPQSHSNLQEMLTVHQRLQAEIVTGHQLLQGLICDAVMATENETKEKRSEVMAQVASLKTGWINSVAVVGQCRSLVKEQLHQWRTYRHGLKVLWKLLKNVDILVPPPGPAPCALQQLQSCADLCQCVEEALGLHSTVYAQTLAAGRYLCETVAEGECLSRLQAECQVIDEAWERATSLLRSRSDLVNTTVQKWSECQDEIINIMSGLDELQTRLKQQLPERSEGSEDETFIQESERSLQHLASGMKELATMKTDLSQYVTAGDSALLEQQLEQLHSQWEELCMKVSLRRQEIADSLNAWTIFNDKNREFCNWLTQMENKVCHSGDLSIKDMVEKLKKDCMEEINLFSENKSHLKQLGEQLLLASDEAKHTQVHSSLQEVSQRWHNLFHQIEARVKKLKETLVTVQQLDKNMSNLRLWLSRIEAELSRPITYNVCHLQEIQRRLAEQQELQKDIEQHTEGVASVLSLCDVLLRDEDAAGDAEAEGDSLQETSRSLDQRWRTICAMALDRRLRIEETWRLWCKFLDDYSQFEDWLKMAEHTAANPNSADVLYTVAKEELKTFEGFQRQVHEHLTQLELLNNQYRRLARENRTDRASQLKAMVHEGNRRWDTLRRRVAAILRRLKHFTSQREEFERTRESMLAWLAELDLQLTNVEHFSESDIHHKIQQLNSFQKEITLNTECIDGLIVFGESLIQKSSPQDAALIEDELQELHSYCQEVFSRLVRFHQRLSQPPIITVEPELSGITFCLESSLELIGRPWLGRSQGSLPATPTHLLESPLERSGRETPVSVDSLPLEWDHTGDVGGSSSHEDEDEEEEGTYFSALSAPGRSKVVHESPRWPPPADTEPQPLQQDAQGHTEAPPALASTPLQQGYLRLMSQCSGSIENIRRVSLILDDKEQPEELGLTGLMASDKQSGVIERWELLQAQPSSDQQADPREPQWLASDLDNITSWLETVILELGCPQQSDPAASVEDMEARAKELKELQKTFTHYKSVMLSVNLRAQKSPDLQERLVRMNRDWSRACTGLQQRDTSLRKTLMHCQDFHETLHSLLLWLAHAESRRYTVDISCPDTPVRALQQHHKTLTDLQAELRDRRAQQASLQALWSQLQPQDKAEENDEAREKLHVTGSKLKLLLREVEQDLSSLQQRLGCESVSDVQGQSASAEVTHSKKGSSTQREMREPSSPPRSFFSRVLRAAFPLHLLLLLLLLLPCLILLSASDSSCTVTNNFARSFYPMLHYTNGPPPT